jgi:hypothetical protein
MIMMKFKILMIQNIVLTEIFVNFWLIILMGIKI